MVSFKKYLFCCFVSFFCRKIVYSQTLVRGHVYADKEQKHPIDSVNVRSLLDDKNYSNQEGYYNVNIGGKGDTLFFFYRGTLRVVYPISNIKFKDSFNVVLYNIPYQDSNVLPEVKVFSRNFRADSLRDRLIYKNVFDYEPQKLRYGKEVGLVPPRLDIDALIKWTQFDNKRRNKEYKNFAENNEHAEYVEHRFNKSLIENITSISDDSILTDFINKYKPSYEQLANMNDLELEQYILDKNKEFKKR